MTSPDGASLPDFDPAAIVDLDVRVDIAGGREPLPRIVAAARALPPGHVLHVRSPFRPTPLFARLAELGFASHCTSFAEDDWSSWFWRADTRTPPRAAPVTTAAPSGVLDLRLLPPPEPLLRILELVETHREPFDVLLPFYPEPLVALLEPSGRRVVLVENRPDGAVVRIEAAGD